MGRANVVFASSPYAGGEFPVWVTGRSGSSNVTRPLLPDGRAVSDIVFLLSFFSVLETFKVTESSGWLKSADGLGRLGILILDFFFVGFEPVTSTVGAVVIISGARNLC